MIQLNFSGETVIHASVDFDATEAVLPVVTPEPYPQTFKFAASEVDGGIQFGPYTVPHAEPGTLRLYGEDGSFKDIPWSVGSNLIMGADGDVREPYNLNTTTSIAYLYCQKSNFSLPNGITFAGVSNYEGAFYQVNGLTFASGVKVCGDTNQYEFYGAKNITFTDKVVLTGNCTMMFANADSTVVFNGGFDYFSEAVVLDSVFSGTQIAIPDKQNIDIYLPKCTDMRGVFQGLSGFNTIKVVAPECTTAENLARAVGGLTELYVDMPKCTTITTQPTAGGGNWGLCGLSGSLRKLTTIMPKLLYGTYLAESCYGCREWYGDLSSVTGLQAGFNGWAMDAASVKRLADTLPAFTSGSHPIGWGIDKALKNDPDVLADIQRVRDKGWSVTLQWN